MKTKEIKLVKLSFNILTKTETIEMFEPNDGVNSWIEIRKSAMDDLLGDFDIPEKPVKGIYPIGVILESPEENSLFILTYDIPKKGFQETVVPIIEKIMEKFIINHNKKETVL